MSGPNAYSAGAGYRTLLAMPNIPEVGTLTQFMHIVRMCMLAEKYVHGIDVLPYVVRPATPALNPTTFVIDNDNDVDTVRSITKLFSDLGTGGGVGTPGTQFIPYYDGFAPIDFARALEFSGYQDVILRFGHYNPPGGTITNLNDPPGSHANEWGFIEPTCGEIQFEVTSLDSFVVGQAFESFGAPVPLGGISVQQHYWLLNRYPSKWHRLSLIHI